MIKAMIVDDEPNSCEVLAALLERYCPDVQVCGIFNNGENALISIRELQPDLVFLDVEMPKMNGFEMLEQLPDIKFNLIFTTSYDKYALKAFKFSALDYLMKPIDREELIKAVTKVISVSENPVAKQLEILMQKLAQPGKLINKIALPTMDGLQMISVETIVSCESVSNYTKLYLKDKKTLVVSRTLKEMEEMLEDFAFFRVHHSYIANLNEIQKYFKGDGSYLLMSDGSTVDVARSKKESLLQRLSV
jgi:two-component system, LytTR family, response regulator